MNHEVFQGLLAGLPTCTDFCGTYRFWPSITISRFHAVVYQFWKMREFLGLADFVLFCFRRYSRINPAFCTYRHSRRCVAAIKPSMSPYKKFPGHLGDLESVVNRGSGVRLPFPQCGSYCLYRAERLSQRALGLLAIQGQ